MLSFEEALGRLLAIAPLPRSELVPAALASGRVLAEDLVAGLDMPAFDHSAMDGYAVLATEATQGAELPVEGESAAGHPFERLAPGTACRIFTGAKLPAGADAVVMQEDVTRTGDRVRFGRAAKPGGNVRRRGEDLAAGSVALAAGTRLGPGQLGLVASLDRTQLLVTRAPVVSILCSGDELRAAGSGGDPTQIPESNGPYLAAALARVGARARLHPFVPDELGRAEAAVRDALDGSDVVLTVGGVSVGDHDVMKDALERAGVVLDFWKVAIKPGKPLCVGREGHRVAVGLPGNPASASLVFVAFVAPLLRTMLGEREVLPPRLLVRVKGDYERTPGRLEFLRARLGYEGGEAVAELARSQSSGAPTSFGWADSLVLLPPERAGVIAGEKLEAFRIADAFGG